MGLKSFNLSFFEQDGFSFYDIISGMHNDDSFNLHDGFNELEAIVKEFESGDVDLESGIPKFKKGMELAKKLRERLKVLENEIEEVNVQFEEMEK